MSSTDIDISNSNMIAENTSDINNTADSSAAIILPYRRYAVVSACYNVAEYLNDFLTSLTGQTVGFENNIQVILVDDGSTDNTPEIIKEWQKRYPGNIVCIHKENGGQALARNYGLNYVNAEWVTFTDPDDFLNKDYFAVVESFLNRNMMDSRVSPFISSSGTEDIRESSFTSQKISEKKLSSFQKSYYENCSDLKESEKASASQNPTLKRILKKFVGFISNSIPVPGVSLADNGDSPDNLSNTIYENEKNGNEINSNWHNVKVEEATGLSNKTDEIDKKNNNKINKENRYSGIALIATNLIFYREVSGEYKNNHPLSFKFKFDERVLPIENMGRNIHLHAASTLFRTELLKKQQILFPDIRPNFEDGYFVCRYLLANSYSRIAFLKNACYYYRKRRSHDSSLDKSWHNPGRYSEVFLKGYLPLLKTVETNNKSKTENADNKDNIADIRAGEHSDSEHFRKISMVIQRTVLYSLMWHVFYFHNDAHKSGFLTPEEILFYKRYFEECLSLIDTETILNYGIPNAGYYYRYGVISCFKKAVAESLSPLVFIERFDFRNRQLLLRYSSTEIIKDERELFLINFERVTPVYSKWIEDTWLDKTFVYQRLVWVSVDFCNIPNGYHEDHNNYNNNHHNHDLYDCHFNKNKELHDNSPDGIKRTPASRNGNDAENYEFTCNLNGVNCSISCRGIIKKSFTLRELAELCGYEDVYKAYSGEENGIFENARESKDGENAGSLGVAGKSGAFTGDASSSYWEKNSCRASDNLTVYLNGEVEFPSGDRSVWLFLDRADQADDNAEHLYRYVKNNCPDRRIYYILSRNSKDWQRLANEGFNLIDYGSEEHLTVYNLASVIISSHIDKFVSHPFRDILPENKKFVFLRHGVAKDDGSSWLNSKVRIDLIVATTNDEYNSMVGAGSRYLYTEKEVKLLGMARFDELIRVSGERKSGYLDFQRKTAVHENNSTNNDNFVANPEKFILIIPTWRTGLYMQMATVTNQTVTNRISAGSNSGGLRSEESRYKLKDVMTGESGEHFDESFTQSEYFKAWQGLLTSDELRKLLVESGFRAVFMPHTKIAASLEYWHIPEWITVVKPEDVRIQRLLAGCELLITDYSSVAFDVAVLNKPVLYYQFDEDTFWEQQVFRKGYFDYRTKGFGDVCVKQEELLEQLKKIILSGCRNPQKYTDIINSTFKYHDAGNCRRIVEALKKI